MTFEISAQQRTPGQAETERAAGRVPSVVYGPEIEAQSISVAAREFERLYNEAGESSLIDLTVEGQSTPITVIIQEVQYDPLKNTIRHVDFRQVKMGEAMHANVELVFVGEAPAVKTLGGTLIRAHEMVEITCLPKDLISHIDVDLSVLATFEDAIHVKDLKVPETVTILDEPETVIAKVTPALTEEEIKAMEEEGPQSIEDIEVAKKEKKDDEAGEGETEEKSAA